MPVYYDQLDRAVDLPNIPRRIISLVPSQTELLHSLGLEEEVIGITKFCVHPESWFRSKKRVGGTKSINMELVHQLAPDLIIANKEENVQDQVAELGKHFPVWVSDIHDLPSALDMMHKIGSITGKAGQANSLIEKIKEDFSRLASFKPLHTCYLIWRKPYMTIGADTFIHDMLTRCGLVNVFQHFNRYPEINLEQLQDVDPGAPGYCELVMLSSEPYPFSSKHIEEIRHQLPVANIILVDGEMFSWYGSRLLHAPKYFSGLLDLVKQMV